MKRTLYIVFILFILLFMIKNIFYRSYENKQQYKFDESIFNVDEKIILKELCNNIFFVGKSKLYEDKILVFNGKNYKLLDINREYPLNNILNIKLNYNVKLLEEGILYFLNENENFKLKVINNYDYEDKFLRAIESVKFIKLDVLLSYYENDDKIIFLQDEDRLPINVGDRLYFYNNRFNLELKKEAPFIKICHKYENYLKCEIFDAYGIKNKYINIKFNKVLNFKYVKNLKFLDINKRLLKFQFNNRIQELKVGDWVLLMENDFLKLDKENLLKYLNGVIKGELVVIEESNIKKGKRYVNLRIFNIDRSNMDVIKVFENDEKNRFKFGF